MAKRNGLMAGLIGKLIGGGMQPEANDAAGAQPSFDDDGNMVGYVDANNNDVTEDAKKYGTGPVKRPSMGMRIFNPEAASRADSINTTFLAQPAEAQQQYDIQQDQLRQSLQRALPGEDPDKLDQYAAMIGTKAISSGVNMDELNRNIAGLKNLQGGMPELVSKLNMLQAQNELQTEQSYRDSGGPQATGVSRASIAKLGGEQAESGRRLLPLREGLESSSSKLGQGLNLGALGRLQLTNQVLDQETTNRLAEAQNVTPQQVQLQAAQLAAAIGRQPTEAQVEQAITENKLAEQRNIVPLEQQAQQHTAEQTIANQPLADQARRNALASAVVSSAQPPADVQQNPMLFTNPNVDDIAAGRFSKAYGTGQRNPLFMPGMFRSIEAGQRIGERMGGQTQAAPPPRMVQMPDGTFRAVNATLSTPAPTATASFRPSQVNLPSTPVSASSGITVPPNFSMGAFPAAGKSVNPFAQVGNVQQLDNGRQQRIQYLMNKRTTYTITPDEENELQQLQGQLPAQQ